MSLFSILLILFTVIPLLELFILISIGTHLGAWNTVLLVLITALTGAWLARKQGLSVLGKIRKTISEGKMPTEELLDGFMIVVAAIFLITPGLLTDVSGIFLLIPPFRRLIKKWIKNKLQNWINKGGRSFHIKVQ